MTGHRRASAPRPVPDDNPATMIRTGSASDVRSCMFEVRRDKHDEQAGERPEQEGTARRSGLTGRELAIMFKVHLINDNM
jgi:hypothetical protein